MIDQEKFNEIKSKYGHYASWGVWAEEGEKPKENVGNLSVLDPAINARLMESLNPNVILVGLNISGRIERSLGNFHSPSPRAHDYKIRYALKNTPFWGCYITDIIKDFEQKCSGKMKQYLKHNPQFEKDNIETFLEEIKVLGAVAPKIVAFGDDVFSILNKYLLTFDICKVQHYSYTGVNKMQLREQFRQLT